MFAGGRHQRPPRRGGKLTRLWKVLRVVLCLLGCWLGLLVYFVSKTVARSENLSEVITKKNLQRAEQALEQEALKYEHEMKMQAIKSANYLMLEQTEHNNDAFVSTLSRISSLATTICMLFSRAQAYLII